MESLVYNQSKLVPMVDELIDKLQSFKNELIKKEKTEIELKVITEKEAIDDEPELSTKKTPDEANEDFKHLKRKDNFSATDYHDMYDNQVNPVMII